MGAVPARRRISLLSQCDCRASPVYLRSDAEIRDEVAGEVLTDYVGTNPALVDVSVTEGVVTLRGEVEKKSMIPLAVQMTRAVDGVVHVVNRLTFAIDDTHLPLAADLTDY